MRCKPTPAMSSVAALWIGLTARCARLRRRCHWGQTPDDQGAGAMTATVSDGKTFAAKLRRQVADHVQRLKDKNGITRIAHPDKPGTANLVGDVEQAQATQVAAAVTPAPGGVGPMTVAILLRHAPLAQQRQLAAGWLC